MLGPQLRLALEAEGHSNNLCPPCPCVPTVSLICFYPVPLTLHSSAQEEGLEGRALG